MADLKLHPPHAAAPWWQLDARGLLCPMPVIRTQTAVAGLPLGAVLAVTCTDPGCLQDLPAWCRVHAHELVAAQTLPGPTVRITLIVSTADAP